ncbi:MAG: hypothetical protein JXA57_10370 [Armatimonadetes bacterium]|nr:hypothetical protein [Armatimonadota bacterium]
MKRGSLGLFGLVGLLGLAGLLRLAGSGGARGHLLVTIPEVVAWIVAAISLTLLIKQWRDDPMTPLYMMLQGIMKSCNAKWMFYFGQLKAARERGDSSVSAEQYLTVLDAAAFDFRSLTETLMGAMKSAMPGKDLPTDLWEYTKPRGISMPVAQGPGAPPGSASTQEP